MQGKRSKSGTTTQRGRVPRGGWAGVLVTVKGKSLNFVGKLKGKKVYEGRPTKKKRKTNPQTEKTWEQKQCLETGRQT